MRIVDFSVAIYCTLRSTNNLSGRAIDAKDPTRVVTK